MGRGGAELLANMHSHTLSFSYLRVMVGDEGCTKENQRTCVARELVKLTPSVIPLLFFLAGAPSSSDSLTNHPSGRNVVLEMFVCSNTSSQRKFV